MKIINQNNWKRKEHYEFFSSFDEPLFSLVANVECTNAYKESSKNNISFFAYYLHRSLLAVNQIPEFRYRVVVDEVVLYDVIHASPTIGRSDHTFGIGYVPFNEDFKVFADSLETEKQRIKNCPGLGFNKKNTKNNVIHYSSIPWVSFTGLSHPRNFKILDCVPKISFGKVIEENNKFLMPVSILAHHGLMDGLHMSQYFKGFEELLMNNNEL